MNRGTIKADTSRKQPIHQQTIGVYSGPSIIKFSSKQVQERSFPVCPLDRLKLAVKVADIFGNDTMKVIEVLI